MALFALNALRFRFVWDWCSKGNANSTRNDWERFVKLLYGIWLDWRCVWLDRISASVLSKEIQKYIPSALLTGLVFGLWGIPGYLISSLGTFY